MEAEHGYKNHLQFIYLQARGNILELGVREGISTSAFLYGVEQNGGHVWSVDLNEKCAEVFRDHKQWTFIHGNSLDVEKLEHEGVPKELDLLFCDTTHTLEQVNLELKTWGPRVTKDGLILVNNMNDYPQVKEACETYAKSNGLMFHVRVGGMGLGMIFPSDRKGELK